MSTVTASEMKKNQDSNKLTVSTLSALDKNDGSDILRGLMTGKSQELYSQNNDEEEYMVTSAYRKNNNKQAKFKIADLSSNNNFKEEINNSDGQACPIALISQMPAPANLYSNQSKNQNLIVIDT